MNVMFEEIEYPNKTARTSKRTLKPHTDMPEQEKEFIHFAAQIYLKGFKTMHQLI